MRNPITGAPPLILPIAVLGYVFDFNEAPSKWLRLNGTQVPSDGPSSCSLNLRNPQRDRGCSSLLTRCETSTGESSTIPLDVGASYDDRGRVLVMLLFLP
jgi:hypothetical protein